MLDYDEFKNVPLEKIFQMNTDSLFKERFLRYAGGFLNHTMFFEGLTSTITKPSFKLSLAINNAFGSFEHLNHYLEKAMVENFGSGWTFLTIDVYNNLRIVNAKDQYNPLIKKQMPILSLDTWEHSYFLDYKNNRTEYSKKILSIINWDVVSSRFESIDYEIIS